MVNSRTLASLNAAAFTGSQIALVPLFPFFAERTGLSLAQVLGSFAFGSALFVWGSPYWAKLSDQRGRPRVLFLGSAGLAISLGLLLLLVLISNLPPLLALTLLGLSRLLYGLLASSIAPVAQAWQSDLHGTEAQNAAMTHHSLALSAGRLGALLAVVALAPFPLAILGALTALAVVVTAFNARSAREVPLPRPGAPAAEAAAPHSFLLAWPIFALAFLFTGSVELVNSSLSGTLQHVFQLDAAAAARFVGQLLLGASAVVLITQTAARRVLRRTWKSPLVVGLLSLLAGATLLGSAVSRPQVWAALALISVALGLIPPSYLSALAGSTASRAGRGRAAGLLASTQTLGYAAGAGLGAWSFHFFPGERGPALSTIVMFALVVGFVLLFRRPAAEVRL
jgi:MFS family permease